MRITMRWAKHLIGCQRKGREAFLRGEPKDSCPYKVQQSYGTGGRNLTRQRREYWLHGWDLAMRETTTDGPSEDMANGPGFFMS